MGDLKLNINKEWAKKAGKEKFIFELSKSYPNLDLSSLYDIMFPPKKEDKKVSAK